MSGKAHYPMTLLSSAFLTLLAVPHSVEDYAYGVFARFGLDWLSGGVLLGAVFAVQLASAGSGSRIGIGTLGAIGAAWCVGALVDHGHDLILGTAAYRHGLSSKLLEAAIVFFGALTALVATAELRRPRRARLGDTGRSPLA